MLFLEKLKTCQNPCGLLNAKHLQGFKDNRYRWELSHNWHCRKWQNKDNLNH